MSITEIAEKGKQIRDKVKSQGRPLLLILILILTTSLSYGLGRMNRVEEGKAPMALVDCAGSPARLVSVLDQPETGAPQLAAVGTVVNEQIKNSAGEGGRATKAKEGQVFASKNGKKYYYSWCSGGSRIKAANKVYFGTSALAEAAGYTIAAGCK